MLTTTPASQCEPNPPHKDFTETGGREIGASVRAAGSSEEAAETAFRIGWPGAFSLTARQIGDIVRSRLLWREE